MAKDMMGYSATTAPQGSRVVLIVSSGPPHMGATSFVTMPDVIGKNQGAALEEISRTSLQTQVVYDYHPVNRKGTVTATRPAPLTNTLTDTDALLLVSSGEPMSPRPTSTLPVTIGMTEGEAIEQLRSVGLSGQVMYEPSATVPAGHVIDQLPNRNTYANMDAASDKGKLWTMVGIAAAVLLLIVLGFFMLGGMDMFAKEKIEVPDVVGMTEEQAVAALDEAGFEVGTVTDKEATEEYPNPGTVLATKPGAGELALKGSKIDLDVVIDPSKVRAEVPKVVGKTAEEATTLLEQAGFIVNPEYIATDKYGEGIVAEQTPAGGTKSHKEATVTIRISTGPAADIVVPDLVGLTEESAKSLLANVGLAHSVSYNPSDGVAAGTVLSSSPSAGTQVKPGTNVALVVSSGRVEDPKITIPNYVGWNSLDAQNNLASLGLVGILNPQGANGEVLSTAPASGSAVDRGATVTINVKTGE